MRRYLLISLLLATPYLASAQGISQLQQWKTGGTNIIQPTNSAAGLLVPGLATSSTGCLSVGSSGWISANGSACGAGGNSFEWTPQSYGNSTSTTLALLNGLLVNGASTTITGALHINLSNGELFINNGLISSGATTTAGTGLTFSGNAFNVNSTQSITKLSNLSSNGIVYTSGGNGTLNTTATSSLFGTLGTPGFVLMSSNGGIIWAATSSLATSPGGSSGQLQYNGSGSFAGVATTSLTASGVLTLSNPISVIGGSASALTLTGGANGQTLAWLNGVPAWTATTTFSAPFVYSGGNVTCTLASAGVTGCLNGTDWSTFNNKQATISASWPITLAGATVGFNGLSTSTAAVQGNIPYFSGVNTFANVATTSASCSGTVSCSAFTVIGSGPITITGSGGGSGTGNVATSSTEAANQIPYWTSNGATPALLSGGSSGFTFNGITFRTNYASTTQLTAFSNIKVGGVATTTINGDNGTSTFNGSVAISTTSPTALNIKDGYGTTAFNVSNASTTGNLFEIGSSTLLFSVAQSATTTIANGVNITSGCFSFNGTCITGGAGVVTNVTGTYPIQSSGGSTPAISLAFGTTTANTWSQLQTFTGGFLSSASSTVNATLTLPQKATPAGAFLAVNPSGDIIATTSPTSGNTVTTASATSTGANVFSILSVVPNDVVMWWVQDKGGSCINSTQLEVLADIKQSTMAATSTRDIGDIGGQNVILECSTSAHGYFQATTTETVTVSGINNNASNDFMSLMVQKIH